jgi:hypothetical protein
MGKMFELRTNHNGQKYLFDQPTLNARKTRWLEFLSEYDFDIKHIKGKENKVVDALNRRLHELHATTISMCQSYLKHKNYRGCKFRFAIQGISGKITKRYFVEKNEEYKLDNDEILMYRGRIYVPNY